VTALRQLEVWTKRQTPGPVREGARRGVRAFGIVTAPLRPAPDFLIIGTKRGGTTSLFNYLLEHPLVAPLFPALENRKGVHYLDANFNKGRAWYRSHFPTALSRTLRGHGGRPAIVGESSPYYLFHPHAPRRARYTLPDVKLIVLLRNPVDRAFSHYKERTRNGVEDLTFEEALDQEPARLSGELERMRHDPGYNSFAHEHFSYVSQGFYLPQLERWMDEYPLERFCIIRSEDLFEDPPGTYAAVLRFLGLPTFDLKRYKRFNYHPSDDMDPATRDRLVATFAEHNRRLAGFLGRALGWN
jgi:hypothetical protein